MFKKTENNTFSKNNLFSSKRKIPETKEEVVLREITEYPIDLFNHQKEGIDFLLKRKKAILADEMGLGKTR